MLKFSVPIHCTGTSGVGVSSLLDELSQAGGVINTPTLEITVKFIERRPSAASFGVLFVYSIINRASFDFAVQQLIRSSALVKILVGTHRDEQERREVRYIDVQSLEEQVSDIIWLETGKGCSNVELLHDEICAAVEFRVKDVLNRNDVAMMRILENGETNADDKPALLVDKNSMEEPELLEIAADQQYEEQFFFEDEPVEYNFEEPPVPKRHEEIPAEDLLKTNQPQLSQAFEAFLKASNTHVPKQEIEEYISQLRDAEREKQSITKLEEELRKAQTNSEKSIVEREQRLETLYEQGLRAMKSNRQVISEKDDRINELEREVAQLKSVRDVPEQQAVSDLENDLVLSNIENITPIKAEYSGVYLDPKQEVGGPSERPAILQSGKSENVLDGMRFKKLEQQLRDVSQNKFGMAPVENVRLMTGNPSPELLVREKIDLVNSRIIPTRAITLEDICASAERHKIDLNQKMPARVGKERTIVLNNTYYQITVAPGQDARVAARQFLERRRLGMAYLDEVTNQLMREDRLREASERPLFQFTVKIEGRAHHGRWYKTDTLEKVAKRIMAESGSRDRRVYEQVCAEINAEYIKHQ